MVNDSELVARQIGGEYKVKHAGLKPLFLEAMRTLRAFDKLGGPLACAASTTSAPTSWSTRRSTRCSGRPDRPTPVWARAYHAADMKTRLILALTCAAALAGASPAGAAIVPGQAVDGPSADISAALPRVDVAPDGSAALVYLKTIDGEEHPFVSRLVNGAWKLAGSGRPGLE